jgi:hypothetical protein
MGGRVTEHCFMGALFYGPILDEVGVLVGIVTRRDILSAIVNHAPIELWT